MVKVRFSVGVYQSKIPIALNVSKILSTKNVLKISIALNVSKISTSKNVLKIPTAKIPNNSILP